MDVLMSSPEFLSNLDNYSSPRSFVKEAILIDRKYEL